MNSEADALLDAIWATPNDDTPRLVYADWLQDHGHDEYAEFIRLQCAVAQHTLWSDEANRLWVEIGRVWKRFVDRYTISDFSNWVSSKGGHFSLDASDFHRGFLHPRTGVPIDQMALRWREWWPWLPTPITRLCLIPGWIERVIECPLMYRIHGLRLDAFKKADLFPLVKAPCFRELRLFDAENLTITQLEFELLLRPGVLPAVVEIRLDFRDVLARCAELRIPPPEYYRNQAETRARLEAKFSRVTILGASTDPLG